MSSTEPTTKLETQDQKQQNEQNNDQQQEETMPLEAFTKEPLHHGPNDDLVPEIVEDDWELSIPSGFLSSLPNNPEWPVTQRLIYNFTQDQVAKFVALEEQVKQNVETIANIKDAPQSALVTGVNGLVGPRLIHHLVQRGCQRIVAIDNHGIKKTEFKPKKEKKEKTTTTDGEEASNDEQQQQEQSTDEEKVVEETVVEEALSPFEQYNGIVQYHQGNVENTDFVTPLLTDIEVVFHCEDLHPFNHNDVMYDRINHHAVVHLLKVAEECGVKKFVQLTTPESRLSSSAGNITNYNEVQLTVPSNIEHPTRYLASKARGDRVVQEHNTQQMMTVCIAPVNVYGEQQSLLLDGDQFILPQLLDVAVEGDLRMVGDGNNIIDITHVDNVCHALILAANKMTTFDQAPAGNFYTITDDFSHHFWGLVDDLLIRGGLESVKTRTKAPRVFASVAGFFSKVINPTAFLNPYIVKLLQSTRTFDIEAAKQELGYVPIVTWKNEWKKVCKSLLEQFQLPVYPNTKFYYEGVQFDGFSKEVEKMEAEKRAQEREQIRLEREAAFAARQAEKEEADRKAAEADEDEAAAKKAAEADEDEKKAAFAAANAVSAAASAPVIVQDIPPQPQDDVLPPVIQHQEPPPQQQPIEQEQDVVAPVEEVAEPQVEQEQEQEKQVEEEVAQQEDDAPVEQQQDNNNSGKGKKGKKGRK